jgi:hypothetical protein
MVNDDPSDDEFIPSPNIHPGILEPQRSACLPLVRVCARAHAFRYSQVDDPPGRLAVPHVLAPFPIAPAFVIVLICALEAISIHLYSQCCPHRVK